MRAVSETPLLLLSEFEGGLSQTLTDTDKAARVRRFVVQASQLLSRLCDRRFDERIETRYYTARSRERGGALDGQTLVLDDDLRAITTLTNGDSSTIAASAYLLLPRSEDAKTAVFLTHDGNAYWRFTNDAVEAIAVLGTWGYGGAWVDTSTTLNGALTDSATSATVNDGTQIEVGMTLKINSEYMFVDAIATHVLTVQRGVNGSTAASHSDTDGVEYWRADAQVRGLVSRLVRWAVEQDKSPLAGQATVGEFTFPVDVTKIPRDVAEAISLAHLKRRAVYHGAV